MLFAGYILKNCATVLDATNFSKTGKFFFLFSESCFLDRCCSPVSRLLDADRGLQYLLSLLHNHVYLPYSNIYLPYSYI